MQALHALEREAVNAARQVERYYEQGRLVGLEDPLPAADLVNEVTTGQWRNVEGETKLLVAPDIQVAGCMAWLFECILPSLQS